MFHRVVEPPHESIEQAFLDMMRFPNSQTLKSDTLMGFGSPHIAGGVNNCAAAEIPYILIELNDGLSQVLFNLPPPYEFP